MTGQHLITISYLLHWKQTRSLETSLGMSLIRNYTLTRNATHKMIKATTSPFERHTKKKTCEAWNVRRVVKCTSELNLIIFRTHIHT